MWTAFALLSRSGWAERSSFQTPGSTRPSLTTPGIWMPPGWVCLSLAAGIPTLMQAEEGRDLVVTPRDLDGVIAHGAALLGAAINRALQPKLSVAQLCWLVG